MKTMFAFSVNICFYFDISVCFFQILLGQTATRIKETDLLVVETVLFHVTPIWKGRDAIS